MDKVIRQFPEDWSGFDEVVDEAAARELVEAVVKRRNPDLVDREYEYVIPYYTYYTNNTYYT